MRSIAWATLLFAAGVGGNVASAGIIYSGTEGWSELMTESAYRAEAVTVSTETRESRPSDDAPSPERPRSLESWLGQMGSCSDVDSSSFAGATASVGMTGDRPGVTLGTGCALLVYDSPETPRKGFLDGAFRPPRQST